MDDQKDSERSTEGSTEGSTERPANLSDGVPALRPERPMSRVQGLRSAAFLGLLASLPTMGSEPNLRHRHTTFGPREVKKSGDPQLPGKQMAKRKARRKMQRRSSRNNRGRR